MTRDELIAENARLRTVLANIVEIHSRTFSNYGGDPLCEECRYQYAPCLMNTMASKALNPDT